MISVIVPIYNIENYLPQCLDSIVSQTYKDLEIILVDDGSTDKSGVICDKYAHLDSRIHVIHQENGGLSCARNTGLKVATGDYILMPDGDDVLHPQMIETLYKLIISGDYDFSMCYGKKVFTAPEDRFANDVDFTNCESICQETLFKNLFVIEYTERLNYSVVWNKLYKRQLLENLYFTLTSAEDQLYSTQVYLRTKSAVVIRSPLYYWIMRSSSISHQPLNAWWVNVLDSIKMCLDSIPIELTSFRAYCLRHLYKRLNSTLYWCKSTSFYSVAKENVNNIQKQTIREFLTNSNISFSDKFIYVFFHYIPFSYHLYIITMGLYSRINKF